MNMNKKLYKSNMCCNCNMNLNSNNIFCKAPDFMPQNPLLANAYVPYQTIENIYSPETALEQGTIFPELDSPYASGQSYMTLMELYMEGGMRDE